MRDVSNENIKVRFLEMVQIATATYGTSDAEYLGLAVEDLQNDDIIFIPMYLNPEPGREDQFAAAFKEFDQKWSNLGEYVDGEDS